jgi:hypothetical protein
VRIQIALYSSSVDDVKLLDTATVKEAGEDRHEEATLKLVTSSTKAFLHADSYCMFCLGVSAPSSYRVFKSKLTLG